MHEFGLAVCHSMHTEKVEMKVQQSAACCESQFPLRAH